jgi:hypothetical protein
VVDLKEGRNAKFFSLGDIPTNLSSTIKGIIEEFLAQYNELKSQRII